MRLDETVASTAHRQRFIGDTGTIATVQRCTKYIVFKQQKQAKHKNTTASKAVILPVPLSVST